MGDTTWMSFNIPTSGTTYSFSGSNNLIYEAQVVNVNGGDNPAGNIVQGCVFTDPSPLISYTNTSLIFFVVATDKCAILKLLCVFLSSTSLPKFPHNVI